MLTRPSCRDRFFVASFCALIAQNKSTTNLPHMAALNVPMTSCPHCNRKMEMLDVLGMDNWRPTVCGYCNKLCMATDRSLVFWFAVFTISMGAVVFTVPEVVEINKMFAGFIALVVWPITFPVIVKAKKYHQRQYWLPKNRLLGYFVYLVIPVGVIVLALALAIHFEVGM